MKETNEESVLDDEMRDAFGFILAATPTLLGLIVGFSSSMATSRYDQRKNCEEFHQACFRAIWDARQVA
jgi:hypothetical protein